MKQKVAAFFIVLGLLAPVSLSAQKTIGSSSVASAPPAYTIVAIPFATVGDTASQGLGQSSVGGVAVGRSIGSMAKAYMWTGNGGLTTLTNLTGKNYCRADGAN